MRSSWSQRMKPSDVLFVYACSRRFANASSRCAQPASVGQLPSRSRCRLNASVSSPARRWVIALKVSSPPNGRRSLANTFSSSNPRATSGSSTVAATGAKALSRRPTSRSGAAPNSAAAGAFTATRRRSRSKARSASCHPSAKRCQRSTPGSASAAASQFHRGATERFGRRGLRRTGTRAGRRRRPRDRTPIHGSRRRASSDRTG